MRISPRVNPVMFSGAQRDPEKRLYSKSYEDHIRELIIEAKRIDTFLFRFVPVVLAVVSAGAVWSFFDQRSQDAADRRVATITRKLTQMEPNDPQARLQFLTQQLPADADKDPKIAEAIQTLLKEEQEKADLSKNLAKLKEPGERLQLLTRTITSANDAGKTSLVGYANHLLTQEAMKHQKPPFLGRK